MTNVDFIEHSRSHSCDQCTRSGRKNVVYYKIILSATLFAKQTVNVNQREKDFTFLHNLHVNQGRILTRLTVLQTV